MVAHDKAPVLLSKVEGRTHSILCRERVLKGAEKQTRYCSQKVAEAQTPNIMNITSNPYYQRALEYIQQNDLNTLPNGRHTIDGDNLLVNIVDSELRSPSEAKFEAHNQYLDIQIPLTAPESYGVKSRSECQQPIGEFNEADDYILFEDEITTIVTRQPGEMIVFTPDDAHAPLIGEGPIHKAIFKVKVADPATL